MTFEVLDMPDVTELLDDAAVFQRNRRMANELERGTTAQAVPPPTAPCAPATIWRLCLHRNPDGTA